MCLNIKRKLALCMTLVMLLALLAGCAKEEQNPAGTVSDFESQTHIQVSVPEDESTPEEASQTTLSGEFVVSEKKYDYKDVNLMLLYVKNQTNQHYNVTIKGKYLDANGKIIKEETQTFGAFPAGWSNHFIFNPRCTFDSFEYELETEDYTKVVFDTSDNRISLVTSDSDGVPLVSYIELTYEKKLDWMRFLIGDMANPEEGRCMFFNGEMANKHPIMTIGAQFHVIVLDTNGNIYVTDYDFYDSLDAYKESSHVATAPVGTPDNGRESFKAYFTQQPRGADESIPDNVQGVFTAIFAIRQVYDYDNLMEQSRKLHGV